MKKVIPIIAYGLFLLLMLSACSIKSNKKLSSEELNDLKKEYEAYLKKEYPDETFTVKVWQEYGTDRGTGLPDYEGYLIRHIVTDSKGNRFRVYKSTGGTLTNQKTTYSDDYEAVLDGRVHYNEKGQTVLYDDEGNVISEYY
jgi:hypothetical protein